MAFLRYAQRAGMRLGEGSRHGVLPRVTIRCYGESADAAGPLQARYPKTFPAALKRLLPILCERGSWNYAEAWARDETSETGLRCIATFNDDAVPESKSFQADSQTKAYSIGDGAIGKAWASSQPEWSREITTHQNAAAVHFKNGLHVPAVVDGEVQAVMSFYSADPDVPNKGIADDFTQLPGPMLHTTILSGDVRPTLEATTIGKGEHGSQGATQGQMDAVFDDIVGSGIFTAAAVYEDVQYFFNTLGLPPDYFDRFHVHEIAQHVTAFMSAKKLAASADPQTGMDTKQEQISARVITDKGHCFMVPADRTHVLEVEKHLDDLRSAERKDKGMSVARYMSEGPAVPYGKKKLMMYVVDIEPYVNGPDELAKSKENPDGKGMDENDIQKVATPGFLARADALRVRYQDLIIKKQNQLRTLTEIGEPLEDGTIPVVIAMRSTTDGKMSTRGMNELISECIGEELNARRKYFTTFSNGLIFYSLYLDPAPMDQIKEMVKRVELLTIVPRESCAATLPLVTDSQKLLPEAFAYSVCASNFAFYFLQSKNPDLEILNEKMKGDPENAARLKRVAYGLQQAAVPMTRIDECVNRYPELVAELYTDFESTFSPNMNSDMSKTPGVNAALQKKIQKEVVDEVDRVIFDMFSTFNQSISKTNFYNTRKSTLAFRVEPSQFFSGMSQFDDEPYGISMIVSNDFRGFHIRFMPVARGGLRLIRSKNTSERSKNITSLFKENYALALTQNKKNKDIPEFGSKGTILLEPSNQSDDAGRFAFMKYISGMMDLLLPTPGEMLDHHGKEEIIFFGPDEGTAGYMADAAYYAKSRDYRYWSACTTGKPPQMGGIPHDEYGMTTRSVHEFVLGTLRKAGLDESHVTKLQTGGPDGDLGSNEITISKDITIGIVDGSGVLFDPNGLNRDELEKVAEARTTIDGFDIRALSSDGKFVSVEDTNVVLPDKSIVESGLAFRNEFHFNPLGKADLFVPCGGRPEAVNAMNVHRLLDPTGGTDHQFKYIVEGANLFITEDARDVLEKAGIILYKDASTNKGGVTSSSFEVLASLCMADEEHEKHMRANAAGDLPAFYQDYVQEIIAIVEENARLEFEAVHKFAEGTGTTRSLTTDILSEKINTLNSACQNSELWEDTTLRHEVLVRAMPQTLQKLLTLETIIERLPEDYLKAVFGYYIASRFVYERGMDAEGFDYLTAFFGHMAGLTKNSKK